MENNNSLQADEVEALAAIYSDSWKIEDEEHHVYSINIQEKTKEKAIFLQVTMPPEYPKESPPFYEISAPWLKGSQRLQLSSMLDEIYCENTGENILFLWIEKIREYVANQEDVQTGNVVETEVFEELFQATRTVEINCDKIPLFHGEPIQDRKSTFQAHLAPVVMQEQVKQVLDELLQNRKIAGATHNIHAYRICNNIGEPLYQDYEDDGEAQAGIRLMHLLQLLDAKNVMVVVSRWYGGIHLGPDRFKHISNAARNILQQCGYINENKCLEDGTRSMTKGKKKKGK